jgi:gliding motility-associated-like protein
LVGTTTVAALGGVARFTDLKITGVTGTYTLEFTSSGLTSATSTNVVIATSSNSKLASLGLSDGFIQPVFSPDYLNYNIFVGSGSTSINLTPTVSDAKATVRVNSVLVVSGNASNALALNPGNNAVTVLVTAENGSTTTYTVNVIRRASNADLSALTTSGGAVSPTFAAATLSYTRSVANNVSSITITPTLSDANASVKVNGITVASGTASSAIALTTGDNTINVVVTAQDETVTKTYTLIVNRDPTPAAVVDPDVPTKLSINTQPTGGDLNALLGTQPVIYLQNASNNLTPSTANVTVAIKTGPVGGSLVGTTTVAALGGVARFTDLKITGVTGTYTLEFTSSGLTSATSTNVVIATSSNSKLASLGLSDGFIQPVFSPDYLNYNIFVGSGSTSINLTPTVSDAKATVRVNSVLVVSGNASNALALNPGNNAVTVLVTAENGSTTTYTVNVIRRASNADLSALTTSGGAVSPTFAAATLSYTRSVANNVSSITITPTLSDANASVKVNGITVASGTASSAIALTTGDNTITIVVAAQDETVTKTYTLTVNRDPTPAVVVDPDVPTKLSINTQPTGGDLNALLGTQPVIYLQNASNNLTPSTATVTVAIKTGPVGGSLVGTTTVAALGGVARFTDLKITGVTGTYTLEFTSSGLTSATSTNVVIAASSNSKLASLGLSDGFIQPVFSPDYLNYNIFVGSGSTSINLTPTVSDAKSTVRVNSVLVVSGNASNALALNPGNNAVTILVTAENGSTTTYTLNVIRKTGNADLSALTTNAGAVSPTFAAATLSYTRSVANNVSSITITPTLSNANATVTVSGNNVASGNASSAIALATGDNTINVVVTAQDETVTKTYTLIVNRDPTPAAVVDPDVPTKLSINTQPTGGDLNALLGTQPVIYLQNASNNLTPSTATVTVAIKTGPVGGSLVGTTTVAALGGVARFTDLKITGVTGTYTLEFTSSGLTSATSTNVVIAASSNSKLASLGLSDGFIQPVFSPDYLNYNIFVGSGSTSINLTPTVSDAKATVRVNSVLVVSGNASNALALNPGNNAVTVLVTAENGSTTTYTVNVIRKAANVNLSNLTTNAGTISPTFIGTTTAYTQTVANNVSSITITPTLSDANASVKVNGIAVANGTPSSVIPLAFGSNLITIIVNAQDENLSKTYTLTITRTRVNLAFETQPQGSFRNAEIGDFTVRVQDDNGNLISASNPLISISLGSNPSSGFLNGTLTRQAVGGKVTFSNLSINKSGVGYAFLVKSDDIANASSVNFNISGLNAGTIGTNQTICYNTIPAALTSLSDATSDAGGITYQWQSSLDNVTYNPISGANAAGYAPGALTQKTYFRRESTTTVEGNATSNVITINVTQTAAPIASNQNFCAATASISDLQATGTSIKWYAAATGGVELTSSTALVSGTTYYASQTLNGCESLRQAVTATVTPIPTVTSTTPATICGTGSLTLSAIPSSGVINWYTAAIGGSSIGTGNSFTTPSLSTTRTYYVDATLNGCTTATRTAVEATVNPIPTISSTTGGTICGTGTVTLAAASLGTINWYAASSGGAVLATGTTFTTPSISTTTTYYVDATNNSCTTATRTAVVATVNPVPTITATTPASICGTGTAVLSATASAGTLKWYNEATGGSLLGTGTSLTIPNLSGTTTYYVETTDNGCTSASRTAVVATVKPIPTITGVTPADICGTGTAVLSATASAGTISWFAASSGGTALATGSSFTTPSISATTTYYVETTDNGCTSAARTAVLATVKIIPTITASTPAARTGPGILTLSATASAGTINWYDASTGGNLLSTENSFTTPSISATTTYYVDATSNGCTTSSRTPITATISAANPTITASTPASICGTGTAVLSATASAGTLTWYDAATAGNVVGTGTSFTTPSISVTTTYYVEADDNGTISTNRTAVIATVKAVPTITASTPASICGTGTAVLSATASAGTLTWYDAATAGNVVGTGTTFTTPSISATTTYYVETTDNGCTSAARTAVIATVKTVPTITASTPDSICGTGTAVLSATVSAGTLTWYDAATAGNIVGTGTTFTTPSISATTTYYVETTNNGCTSATRTAVIATVKTVPTITASTPASICGTGTAVLSATASAGTLTWYDAATAGNIVGTGTTFTTPSISVTTTYYVETTDNGCTSAARTAVIATVKTVPTITAFTPASICGTGTAVLSATASAGTLTWYDAATAGNIVGTGTTFTTPSISATTTYYVETTDNGCTSAARTAVIATVKTVPTITAFTPASICGTGTAVLSATASAGTLTWYDAATTGNIVGTGTTFTTPSISATTTYYVETTDNGCTSATRTAVIATVKPIPTITGVTSAAICGTGTAVLSATASAGTLSWFAASSGGTALATGSSFTTPSISATTTYYVETTDNGCTSAARTAVVATVKTAPTITASTPAARTGPGTLTLGASASAGTISWFAASNGGVALATGSSFTTPSISATTTYYVETTDNGCTSAARTAVVATVKPIPTITGVTSAAICGTGTAVLSATASAGTLTWYDAATAGNIVGTGTSFTTPSISVTTTYYLEADDNGTISATRTAVIATVKTVPTITASTPASICGTGTAVLSATASAGTISWFAASSGGTALATGSSFTTPSISATTTYYVETTDNGCTSAARTAVIATVKTAPTITASTPAARTGPGTLTLGASASAGTISWFAASNGGVALATGSSFTTPSISATTTYYVETTDNGCASTVRTAVIATVNSTNPTVTTTISASICGPGTAILSATASAGTINWYDALTGGNLVGSGNSFTTPIISSNTSYYAEANNNGTISVTRTAVVATVKTVPNSPVLGLNNFTYDKTVKTASVIVGIDEDILWYSQQSGSTTSSAPTGINAGTYVAWAASRNKITNCISDSRVEVKLIISKAPLNIKAENKVKVYGSPNPTFTFVYSGLLLNDTNVASLPSLNSVAMLNSRVGLYAITASGAADPNYEISYTAGQLKIDKAILKIIADDKTKTFESLNPVLTYSYIGFLNNETLASSGLTGNPSLSTLATTNSQVGSYAINITSGNLVSENYQFATIPGILSINKANPTFNLSNQITTLGSAPFNIVATTNSSGSISYISSNPTVATINTAGLVTIVGLGESTITASLASDNNYNGLIKTAKLIVNDQAPSNFSYNPSSIAVSYATGISPLKPIISGGLVESYSISPTLPAGLSFNSTTGIISGSVNTRVNGKIIYTITAINSGGSATTTFTINFNSAPSELNLNKSNLFEANNIGDLIGFLNAVDDDKNDSHYYEFVSGAGDTDNTNFRISSNQLRANTIFNFSTKNKYFVRIKCIDSGGLSFEKEFLISISQTPTITGTGNELGSKTFIPASPNPEISKGFSSQLNVTGSDLVSYSWSPSTGLSATNIANPIASPEYTTNYAVTVTNRYGSSTTKYITIVVNEDYFITPHNILTPNGDGENDIWIIENINSYPDNDVVIFDITGNVLFKTKNYKNDWNGTNSNQPLSDGTYYYIIRIGNSTKKGFITIIK